jgi:hypothetical protein
MDDRYCFKFAGGESEGSQRTTSTLTHLEYRLMTVAKIVHCIASIIAIPDARTQLKNSLC